MERKSQCARERVVDHSLPVIRRPRRGRPESIQDSHLPFAGIKVSQDLDIRVEERADISQKSYASTRNLTALPKTKRDD